MALLRTVDSGLIMSIKPSSTASTKQSVIVLDGILEMPNLKPVNNASKVFLSGLKTRKT